jgi:hypothetical protein
MRNGAQVSSHLTQIVLVTKWSVCFVFTDFTRITLEYEFEYVRHRDGRTFLYQLTKGIQPIYFHELMEHTIERVDISDYCLSLTFDDGDVLNIRTNDSELEAGHIQKLEDFIVF